MGCDIHDFIEIRKPGQKTWKLAYEDVIKGRDYALFGLLAGVRDCPPKLPNGLILASWWARGIKSRPYGEPKGFPVDASSEVARIWAEAGEHSPSFGDIDDVRFWACLDEYGQQKHADLVDQRYGVGAYVSEYGPIGSALRPVLDLMLKMKAQRWEARFVFWFDS